VEWGRRLLPAEYAIRASTRAASINESEALSLLNTRLPTSPGSLAIFAAIRRASSRRYENVQQDHHCAFGRICSWSWRLGRGGDQASSCQPYSSDDHQPEQRWVHGV